MNESAAVGETSQRIVVLGRITGAFGISGWVKVQSYTDPLGNILDYEIWRLKGRTGWQPVKVLEGHVTNKGVQARLEGVADRDEAQAWSGTDIGIPRSELPKLTSGEYYWEDLLGLEAVTPEGALLGKVDHFSETPAHPLMVVKGEREHWIPLVKGRIQRVDAEAQRLVIDWGLDW